MRTQIKTIAIDLDEVVADLMPKFHRHFTERTGRVATPAELEGRKIYALAGGETLREVIYERGFFRDLPFITGAAETLDWLRHHYGIYFVSAAMEFRNSLEDKYDWLHEHLPWVHWRQIVFCGDKSIIGTDYMIDDHAFNLETFRGTPLLFDALHNRGEARFRRMKTWAEVREFFEGELSKDQSRTA